MVNLRRILFAVIVMVAFSCRSENLMINGGFEQSPRQGWIWPAAEYLRTPLDWNWSTAEVQSGAHAVCVTNLNRTNGFAGQSSWKLSPGQIYSWPYQLKPSTNYTLSAYFYNNGTGSRQVFLNAVNLGSGTNDVENSTSVAAGSWVRKTILLTTDAAPSNCWYYFLLGASQVNTDSSQFWYIDSVQLEEGSSATDYSEPDLTVGLGLNLTNYGNLFFETETPTIPFRVYNASGGNLTNVLTFEITDAFNSIRVSSNWSQTVWPAGLTSTQLNVSLPSSGLGYFTLRATLRNRNYDQLGYSIITITNGLADRTNGYFGIHCKTAPYYLTQARRLGFTWNRMFGAAYEFYGNPIEFDQTLTNNSGYIWQWDADAVITNTTGADMEPLLVLGNNKVDIPTWAQDGDGFVNLVEWSNYVAGVVNHYGPLGVNYWEVFNENSGTEGGFATNEARYVGIATNTITWIHDIDSGYNVIGPTVQGLYAYYPSAGNYWLSNTLLVEWAGPMFDVLTHHVYPSTTATENWRARNGLNRIIRDELGYAGEVWNDESGNTFQSGVQNWHIEPIAEANYLSGTSSDWGEGGWINRAVWLPVSHSRFAISNVANKTFHYDGRTTMGINQMVTFQPWDVDGTTKPAGAALAWGIKQLDQATYATSTYVDPLVGGSLPSAELHYWDKGGNGIGFFSCLHRTNTYDIGINSATVTFYDCFGNALSGTNQTGGFQYPIWFIDSGLTGAQLAAGMTVVSNVVGDIVAPSPRVEIGPVGTQDTNKPFRFRWTGRDNVASQTYGRSLSNAVTFQYYVSPTESDYGSVSSKEWVDYDALPASGTFYLKAIDPAGNEDTTTWTWPNPLTPATPTWTSVVFGPRRTTNYYASASAASGGNGTWEAPWHTLESARDGMRTKAGTKTVMLLPGTYRLTNTLTLTSADSNTRWVSQTLGGAQIVGTQPLTNWSVYSGSIYSNNYASQLPGSLWPNFRQLWWNDQRMWAARYPDYVAGHTTQGWAFVDPFTDITVSNFWYLEDDALTWDGSATNTDVVAYPYRGYWPYTRAIESVDTNARDIVIADMPSTFLLRPNDRYYISHKFDQLDSAGEWYQQGKVAYFWPPTGTPDATPPEVPVINCLVRLTNATDVRIHRVQLWGSMSYGVEAISATNFILSASTVKHAGAQGVGAVIIGGQSNTVSGCDFSDIVAIGIDVRGGTQTNLTSSYNLVENCYFTNMLISGDSAAIYLNTASVGATITRNTVADALRAGISVKGNNHTIVSNRVRDTMLESDDGGAIYAYNDDWLGGRGCVIANNWIEGCRGFGFWEDTTDYGIGSRAVGVYLDGTSSGLTVRDNIITDASASGVWLLWGSWNTVSNNLIYATGHDTDPNGVGDWGQIYLSGLLSSGSTWLGLTNTFESNYQTFSVYPEWATQVGFDESPLNYPYGSSYTVRGNVVTKNLIVTTNVSWQPFMLKLNNWLSSSNSIDYQAYWDGGATVVPAELQTVETDWDTWVAGGVDANSSTNDVLLDTGSWRVAAESPALTVGYANISTNGIGVYQSATRASWPVN